MFPNKNTRETREHAQQISDALDALPSLPHDQQDAALQSCNQLIEQTPNCEKGLRVDLAVKGDAGQEVWADVGVVHTSKSSLLDKTLTFFLAEARRPQTDIPSPPLQDYAKRKTDIYLPLLNRAKLQKRQRKRATDPTFLPAIFSHLGEFSEGAFQLIEAFASRTYALTEAGIYTYSQVPALASATHRNSLKNAIAAAIARGFGLMLCATNFAAGPNLLSH